MVEEIKLDEDIKQDKYTPIFKGEYVTVHITVMKMTSLLFIIIGFVLGVVLI